MLVMFILKLQETRESSLKKVSYEKAISGKLQMYNLQPKKRKRKKKYVSDWNGDEDAYAEVKEWLEKI